MGIGGVAVCDSCGMEHSKDRMREKVQEIKGTVEVSNIASIESLMKRGWLALEDNDYSDTYFNKVLDINPEYAPAYVGKLCVDLQIKNEADLANYVRPLDNMPNYQKALRFANAEYKAIVAGYNQKINDRLAKEQQENQQRIPELKKIRERNAKCCEGKRIIFSGEHLFCLRADGTIIRTGSTSIYNDNKCKVENWRNIAAILDSYSPSENDTIMGLKIDGSVVTSQNNYYQTPYRNIIETSKNGETVIGLKSDGTVVDIWLDADIEYEDRVKCKDKISSWTSITAIATSYNAIFGLKSDGTVVAAGKNEYGECNVNGWTDIIAITASKNAIFGLKSDGTVVAIGENEYGECNISGWTDIVAITHGYKQTFGLKSDGSVVATGNKNDADCWRDIVALVTKSIYIYGLKSDGTVVTSDCFNRDNDVQGISKWTDIVALFTDGIKTIFALKADNSLVFASGAIWPGIGGLSKEQLVAKLKERDEKVQRRRQWNAQGLCLYCGGEIGGLFTKKCKKCGMEKGTLRYDGEVVGFGF